jgi:hypothetical protein
MNEETKKGYRLLTRSGESCISSRLQSPAPLVSTGIIVLLAMGCQIVSSTDDQTTILSVSQSRLRMTVGVQRGGHAASVLEGLVSCLKGWRSSSGADRGMRAVYAISAEYSPR